MLYYNNQLTNAWYYVNHVFEVVTNVAKRMINYYFAWKLGYDNENER